MRMAPLVTTVLSGIVVLSGCASTESTPSRYDASTGRTLYESPKVLAGHISPSTGLASGQRIMMQAFAECAGQDCRPSQVQLAFFNDSSSDLNLDYRRLQIHFGGGSLEWEDPSRVDELLRSEVPRGEFIRVPMSRVDFEAMANASAVELVFGRTGATTLQVPHARREAFRDFAQTISGRLQG